jgi:hypothetical protein
MIQIPEVTIKAIIDSLLNKIRSDYNVAADKTQTFIYKCLYGISNGNYVFLDEALKIINTTADDPRKLDTRLLFDRERASIPTIHVTIPGEQPFSDGVGFDEGYQSNIINNPASSMTKYLTRSYSMRFDLLITGSNTFEVVMIYYLLKLALIANYMSLEANGFRNPKIYGGDLRINEQMAPAAFMRILTIDAFYELNVPIFESETVVNDLTFTGIAYE